MLLLWLSIFNELIDGKDGIEDVVDVDGVEDAEDGEDDTPSSCTCNAAMSSRV